MLCYTGYMICSYETCKQAVTANGYCQGHYMQLRRGYDLSPLYNHLSMKDRIEMCLVPGDNGCLIWNGHTDTGGYPNITFKGKKYLVHRAYYKELVGNIESHDTLDHLCRNKMCVNPEHLEPVSRSENVKRMQMGKYYETEIARLVDFIESIGYNSITLKKKD